MAYNSKLLFKGAPRRPSVTVASHLGSGTVNSVTNFKKLEMVERSREGTDHIRKKMFETVKEELHAVVRKVLNGEDLGRSFSAINKDVELLVLYKHSEQSKASDWILDQIDRHIETVEAGRMKESILASEEDDFAKAASFSKTIIDWNCKLVLLLKLFNVLDRAYLYQHPRKSAIVDYGFHQYVTKLLLAPRHTPLDPGLDSVPLSDSAKQLLRVCESVTIASLESGDDNLKKIARDLVSTLSRLNNIAETSFAKYYQKMVLSNYGRLQDEWSDDESSYMMKALAALNEESKFLQLTGFDQQFVEETMQKLNWKLVFSDLANLLEPSIPSLIQPGARSYFSALLRLSVSSESQYGVDSMLAIQYAWGNYVAGETKRVIKECEKSGSSLVSNIAKLWDELYRMCDYYFESPKLTFELRGAMSKGISYREHNRFVLGQLSKFCDNFLKQSSSSDEQLADCLMEAITVFKLISNKNDFLVIYERDVSRRFLLGRNFNFTAEKKLLASILEVVGEGEDSSKLTSMFRDIETSLTRYNDIRLDAAPSVEFNALILEAQHWPEVPKHGNKVVLPNVLNEMLGEFTAKYAGETDRTKLHVLDWTNYSFHQMTLKVEFKQGSKELTLTLVQAIVLMLFEEGEYLSVENIVARTQLDEKLVRRIVTSLSSDKYPILRVQVNAISFNEDFWDKSSKIRIPLGRDKEASLVDDATKIINRNRTSEVRAALVRIMKAEHSLTYPELLAQTNAILSVPASIQEMKVQIDYLLSNEYLGRQGTSNTLIYIP